MTAVMVEGVTNDPKFIGVLSRMDCYEVYLNLDAGSPSRVGVVTSIRSLVQRNLHHHEATGSGSHRPLGV
jgi:hypothetical protein